jgi:hypothetical protein
LSKENRRNGEHRWRSEVFDSVGSAFLASVEKALQPQDFLNSAEIYTMRGIIPAIFITIRNTG